MTTQHKHTPLPWGLIQYKNYKGFSIHCSEIGSDFGCIAERWEEKCNEDREKIIGANAAFIVRACNNHYKLIEALESLLPMYSSGIEEPWIIEARKALAQAKGEK